MFEDVLRVLHAGMAQSDEAGHRPNTDVHPSYQYGIVIGRHQGWQEAINAIRDMLKATEDKEKEL